MAHLSAMALLWRFSEKRRFSPGASPFVALLWRFSSDAKIEGIDASQEKRRFSENQWRVSRGAEIRRFSSRSGASPGEAGLLGDAWRFSRVLRLS
jgi:hypothetical protein